jgi:hypothetical protein
LMVAITPQETPRNDAQRTGLGLADHEAGNTDGVENSLY